MEIEYWGIWVENEFESLELDQEIRETLDESYDGSDNVETSNLIIIINNLHICYINYKSQNPSQKNVVQCLTKYFISN